MLNPKYSPKNVVFSLYNLEEGYAPIIADPKNLKPFVHFYQLFGFCFTGFRLWLDFVIWPEKFHGFLPIWPKKFLGFLPIWLTKFLGFSPIWPKKITGFLKTIETSVAKSEMISEIPRKTIDVWDPPTKSQILTDFLKNHRRFLGLQRYPIRSDIRTPTWDLIGLARYSPNHHGFSGKP